MKMVIIVVAVPSQPLHFFKVPSVLAIDNEQLVTDRVREMFPGKLVQWMPVPDLNKVAPLFQ